MTSGCAVPLAPGYKIAKESGEIRFAPGSPATIEVRARFTLQNSGSAPLPFIDLNVPTEKSFGVGRLHVELDGHEAILSQLPEEYRSVQPDTIRIHFDPPWTRGESRELDIEYSLNSPEDSGSHITIGDHSFHLGSRGWAALPQPPHHLFAPDPRRPDKVDYFVRVPSNFLVLARGRMTSRKRAGQETECRFQLRKDDLAPYIVAGRYIETVLHPRTGTVTFWTMQPLQSDPGSAPERIALAWDRLQSDFGPLDANIRSFHVVESPTLRSPVDGESGPAAESFPGGVLVNEEALAQGIASDAFIKTVLHALAHNWFGGQIYPTGAAGIAMSVGLPEYATLVIDEAIGGPEARERRVRDYLTRYRDAIRLTEEKPLGVTTLSGPREQRAVALAKAPLMYVALEDFCGEAPVRNGLKNLVTLLRGQEVGFDDMRSAVEATCGKDLGQFFRAWLYGNGLPSDFLRRYEAGHNGRD
jgi:hypothetical protein